MLDRMLLSAGADDKLYVEDVFSTYLYMGNGSTQTITNGINLSGKGGMVWLKSRVNGSYSHQIYDTARFATKALIPNKTDQDQLYADGLTAFTTSGFSLGLMDGINSSGGAYTSWTFRKAPKFFDVVWWIGNDQDGRLIPHSVGDNVGAIIVKCYSNGGPTDSRWQVWHRNLGGPNMWLNTSDFQQQNFQGSVSTWSGISGYFRLDAGASGIQTVNGSNREYVAYVFAHDETADSIIKCGSYISNGSTNGPEVNLGWEPQWLMIRSLNTGNWQIIDNMRGMPVDSADATLQANLTAAESEVEYLRPTSTGFKITSADNQVNRSTGVTYIYIAIRRGPMKAPTVGTSVFAPVARTGTGVNATVPSGFVTDMVIEGNRTTSTSGTKFAVWDRQRSNAYLLSTTADASVTANALVIQASPWDVMDGYKVGSSSNLTNASSNNFINWMFRRAPGFFDVVCYTGTGVARTVNHNLGVEPELMIVKTRSAATNWFVYAKPMVNLNYHLNLNTIYSASSSATVWNTTAPTASAFTVGTANSASGTTYVAYLFASCPGVSKVGKYTGNGSSQTIDCGFSNGARFVMIKRYDSDGDWYIWDTARGIVAGSDPRLSPNKATAEVTTDDSVDPASVGFAVNQVAATNINVNGASYIYLAIA